MDQTNEKLDLLSTEHIKYLDTLRTFEDYKYVDENKLNIDLKLWGKICNFRRLKIESELKISTYQRDFTERRHILNNLVCDKKNKEDLIEHNKMSILQLENQNLNYVDDIEVNV